MKKIGIMLMTAVSVALLFPAMFLLSAVSFGAQSSRPLLTLEAEKGDLSGGASVSGGKVGWLGKSGGESEGKVKFSKLSLPTDGEYELVFYYYSGSDDRYFDITTDHGSYRLPCPSTGGFDKVGTANITVELAPGGSISVGSDWYAPDLDKIEIYETEQSVYPDRDYSNPDNLKFDGNRVSLILDARNGVYSVQKDGKNILSNARAEILVDNDVISSDDFAKHAHSIDKETGDVIFTHTNHPGSDVTMTQRFSLHDGYITTLLTVTAAGGKTLSSNHITPTAVYRNSLNIDNGVFVQIPFDNDMWIEPKFIGFSALGKSARGYEIAALYDSSDNSGLVIGSLTHDIWKTAIDIQASRGNIMALDLFGGASDTVTHDLSPHGYVSGESVSSPLVFIGVFDDWREGMREYGRACAAVVPPKDSVPYVPIGFNSWGSLQDKVGYSDMTGVSDYVAKYLQECWTGDGGAVYINIDSFWDFITINDPDCGMGLDDALKSFVKRCKKNGQKAGIYFTPFTCWHSTEAELKNSVMEGSGYRYYDAALKKSDGSGLYGKLDGGYALDPTHPGTRARIKDKLKYFTRLGFEYVKLDFMTHGALEGQHHDKTVTTGIQAYNQGMALIDEICRGKMFVDLSISPIFPYQYADGRRISCDAFSSLDNTEHVLSHLSACFWEDEIYPYPDPDHLVVLGGAEGVARCRVTAGVICGTSFLAGDDLSSIKENSADHKRILKMFGNTEIISTAKIGRSFTPLSIKRGARCADAYCLENDGVLYLAVFNFNSKRDSRTIDLTGLYDCHEGLTALELWKGESYAIENGFLKFSISGEDAMIFRIGEPKRGNADGDNESEIPVMPGDNKDPMPFIIGAVIATAAVCALGAFLTIKLIKRYRGGKA